MAARRNSDVDAWFEAKQHPMEEAMQVVRRVTLEADPRIEESIKWSTPTYSYQGNIFSFNPAKKFDAGDVERRAGELVEVLRSWCEWKDAPSS
jgi:uncharacterized protein YdhG (YjbR/CyaY superfamily)